MAVVNHQHDFAHTQAGMACTIPPCTAVVTHAEIATNQIAGQPLNPNYCFKKAGH